MRTNSKESYEPPVLRIHRIAIEAGIAQTTVAVSGKVVVEDWIDEGTIIGADPIIEGGDIFLF